MNDKNNENNQKQFTVAVRLKYNNIKILAIRTELNMHL